MKIIYIPVLIFYGYIINGGKGNKLMTYKEAIIESLQQLNGHAYLKDIYIVFSTIYDKELVSSWKAIIRDILESYSSDSSKFNGEDLFYSVEGVGSGHWGLRDFLENDKIDLTQEDDEFSEGKILLKKHLQRERSIKLIELSKKRLIEKNGRLYCEVCGFDFEKVYGELGNNFIEAHHIKPVSQMSDNEKTSIEDIVMVCSNCHSMIHRKKPWLTFENIKDIIKK